MGLGDAKVALSIGFLLGLSDGASAILIAFWIGAVVALIILFLDWQKRALLMRSSKLKLSKRARTIKREVPFAPFLALGAFIVFFFNVNVFNFLLF